MDVQNSTPTPAQTSSTIQITTVQAPEAEDISVLEFERAPLTDISFGF